MGLRHVGLFVNRNVCSVLVARADHTASTVASIEPEEELAGGATGRRADERQQ